MYISAQRDRASYIPGGIFILIMFTAFERARVSHIEEILLYIKMPVLWCTLLHEWLSDINILIEMLGDAPLLSG